jgi:putative PIN family toxin of toxin-antitoxin system
MKVVVDTNVLISSFLSPEGPPSKVVQMIMDGHLRVCYDMRILHEYAGVLERPKFRISPILSAKLLDLVRAVGELICAAPLPLRLSDQSDMPFLEVALAAQAECLITGNLRHFPSSCRQGMRVFTPAEFLEFYRDPTDWSGGVVKSPGDEYEVSKRSGNRKRGDIVAKCPTYVILGIYA